MSDKPPLPDSLRALGLKAKARVEKLGATAPVDDIAPRATNDYMASPYADEDWEIWACLLLETFGTRNFSVAQAFMRQLGGMIPEVWDSERGVMILDRDKFQLALSIICSLKPRDEAEAAIAVHCVALHLATYRVTDHMGSRSWLDPRTGSALAAITKAYAAQVQILQQMHKPSKPVRQVIKVQKNVSINYTDARQVHLRDRGGGKSGNQPHATDGLRAGARAGELVEITALPSPDESGEAVPFASGEGQAGVPNARCTGRRSKGGA